MVTKREIKKVLIVDDSELIRRMLNDIISSDPMLEVIGMAKDAYEAKEMVKSLSPDVITLDIEMPKVSGLRFLQVLMKANPIPVVMVSTLTEEQAAPTLKALEYGAVDYIAKPKMYNSSIIEKYGAAIVKKVRMAASANVASFSRKAPVRVQATKTVHRILSIGASTGGTEAIKNVLLQLPTENFGVVIAQHMPAGFTTTYAARLNQQTGFQVEEAKGGEIVKPGVAYLAPGNYHLTVRRKGSLLYTELSQGEKVSGHRPSVDMLFHSVAQEVGKTAIGVLLTGMGKDGAEGLKKIKETGGYTLAQDETSCVVFGMPKAAIDIGATCSVQPLCKVGQHIVSIL